MAEDYYTTLGVHRNASEEEINRAYRELVRKFHPDVNPDDPDAKRSFEKVQAAFEVLGDPEQRRAYDRSNVSSGTAPASEPKRPDPDDDLPPSPFQFSKYVRGSRYAHRSRHANRHKATGGPHVRLLLVTLVLLPAGITLLLLGGQIVLAIDSLFTPTQLPAEANPQLEAVLYVVMTLICFVLMLWSREG